MPQWRQDYPNRYLGCRANRPPRTFQTSGGTVEHHSKLPRKRRGTGPVSGSLPQAEAAVGKLTSVTRHAAFVFSDA